MPGRQPAIEDADATLYVVATPIGNLADVTLRALEILRTVPLIAAEDTRITRRLLVRHGIATSLRSYHAKSGAAQLEAMLEHLRAGRDLALVTDAGTPGVSDPGDDLVTAWATEGGRVVPIPGPSAVLAAVVASGVAGPRWSFEGFLPRSGRERRDRLRRIAEDARGTVVFEAPTRLAVTLRDLATACGPGRRAAVCRELTKVHEQVVRGTLGELASHVTDGEIPARGEVVVVIAAADDDRSAGAVVPDPLALSAGRAAVDALVASGLGRREAAQQIAGRTGLPRRDLYRSDPSA
ncbi:MAG TPA: 16S rRNA (cytidine(1402)-2'-O)-methyltransferase [Candidatus Deferrimicrobiaceae bacterium]|nr:16S rRNA (cytidine(1402)-2'-O)-methyltransferase [Candidatus Deferrimicrobiaceae bacterium]